MVFRVASFMFPVDIGTGDMDIPSSMHDPSNLEICTIYTLCCTSYYNSQLLKFFIVCLFFCLSGNYSQIIGTKGL